jgi:hypothetical protein
MACFPIFGLGGRRSKTILNLISNSRLCRQQKLAAIRGIRVFPIAPLVTIGFS